MNIRGAKRIFESVADWWVDTFYNYASSEPGFLRLEILIRVVILFVLTAGFGILYRTLDNPVLPSQVIFNVLFLYFLFVVLQAAFVVFLPEVFESRESVFIQLFIDIIAIAFFYHASGDPRSGIFLLYFLPALTIARFFSNRAILLFIITIFFLTGFTWYQGIPHESYGNLAYWFTDLLPPLGFLAILVVFYMIYHRRRNVIGLIERTQNEIYREYCDLTSEFFSVNQDLEITELSPILTDRHGTLPKRATCNHLCNTTLLGGERGCADCPIYLAIKTEKPVESSKVKFVDYQGFAYTTRLRVTPLIEDNTTVGATVFVEDLSARKRFEAHLRTLTNNLEGIIDLHTQESREQVRKIKKEVNSLLAASSAVLTEDPSMSLQQVAKTTLDLLHCGVIGVREFGIEVDTGRRGLLLLCGEGLLPSELKQRRFLDLKMKSIAVRAFESGELQAVDDFQAHPELDQFPSQSRKCGFRTTVSYPLIAQNQMLGTMTLHRQHIQSFTAHEKELGKSLANLLAAIIFNHRLVARLGWDASQRQRELDALRNLSHHLAPQDDVETLAKLVVWMVKKELKAETAAIFLRDGDVLNRSAIWGVEPDWFPDEHYQVGEGLTGLAALPGVKQGEEYGQVVLENNVIHSQQVIENHLKVYSERMNTKTAAHLIAVPLYGQQGNFGVLRVVNKLRMPGQLDTNGFTQDDVNLMATIAYIVAVAMENTRRLGEKAFLLNLGQSVTASFSPEEVLTTSLNRAVEMLNAEAGFILLMDEQTGNLEFRVTCGKDTERLNGQILPREAGVAYQVAKTTQPHMLNATVQDPRFTDWLYQHSKFTTRSIISVPIRTRRKVVGVFEIINKQLGHFTLNDVSLLEALAPWTGIAIENAHLFTGERKRRQLAESLYKSVQALASTLNLDEIIGSILEHLDDVVHYDTASLYLIEGDKLRLSRLAGFNDVERGKLNDLELDPETDIPFQRVVRSHEPILISDLQDDSILQHVVTERPIRSWICAPLLFHDEVLGMLSVDSFEAAKYRLDDAWIVMAFAQHAAVAIQNARLYGQEKTRARILLELEDHLSRLTLSPDRNSALNETALAARDLMIGDMAGVALYDSERNMIYAEPEAGFIGVAPEYVRTFRFPLDHNGGEVLRKPGVYTSTDAETDPNSIFGHRLIDPIGIKGLIASSLMVGEKPVGILYAAYKAPHSFTEDEKAYFSILANHAAIAIRNSQLLDKSKRRVELLDLFLQISVASQLFTDRERILNIILTGVTAEYGLRFNRAMLLIYDRKQGILVGFTGIGQTDRNEAQRIWEAIDHKNHSMSEYVAEVGFRGIPTYTPVHFVAKNLHMTVDTESQEVFSLAVRTRKASIINPIDDAVVINADFHRLFGPGKFALAPLVVSGEIAGMLVADNKFTDANIGDFELDLLVACANQVAAALERVNLYEEREQRIDILTNLQEVGQHISDLTDPREVLKRIVKAANDVLNADICYLVPYDDNKKEIMIELGVSAGEKTNFRHDRKVSEYGLTKKILEEPGGLIVFEDLRRSQDLYSRFARAEGVVSVAVIRLEFQKRILGLLYVNYCRQHLPSDQDQAILRMFASQAALAINNSRLMEEISTLATQKERDRLRDDLHDVLSTYQFKVTIPAEFLRNRLLHLLGNQNAADEASDLWVAARHTYVQLERILQDMREPVLIEEGLVAAIQHILDAPNLPPIEFHPPVEGPRLPADIELMLYRICQEAIANIVKHAGLTADPPEMASVHLEFSPDYTRLIVQDHGIGFSVDDTEHSKKQSGMGLQGMRNWARNIGAEFEIQSAPQNGTYISVTVTNSILHQEVQS